MTGADFAAAGRWEQLRSRHRADPAEWGVCDVSRDGLITCANAAAAALLGVTEQGLLGQPVAQACGARQGEAGVDSAWAVHGALRDGLIRQADNDTFGRADGTRFAVEYTIVPRIEDGVVVGAMMVFSDLSGRR